MVCPAAPCSGAAEPLSWDGLHTPAAWASAFSLSNGLAEGMPASGAEALRVSFGSALEASAACAVFSDEDGVGEAEVADELGEADDDADGEPDAVPLASSFAVSSEEPQAESSSRALSAAAVSSGRVAVRVPLGVGEVVFMATVSYFSARNAARITCAR
ncbi:hypothetical protein KVA01_02880 [Kocuria varians]|uniref:Uncharacterized protein n=1 Tax=Kocuria varians TaxID=1272 RepID=A0A4Y4D3K4_KOCVA|nr:hypothetical protein KVA01_02880 [Kocuria varians]